MKIFGKLSHENILNLTKPPITREYKNWKNRSTNKNEQLLKIQHYIEVRLLHDRQTLTSLAGRARPIYEESSVSEKLL